jgi:protein-S-isoprenylcysteine O-methyltransferase Ste14
LIGVLLGAFYLLHIAAFFLTANWFIGLTWTISLTAVIAMRVKKEESMMIDKFGDKYRLYMERTGRFLPNITINNQVNRKR